MLPAPSYPASPARPGLRTAAAFVAIAAGIAGLVLARHHPLSPLVAMLAFVAATAVFHRWPAAWLTVLPALLPVVGLAPWSGWITFEEWDLIVLAAAAGGYARVARRAAGAGLPQLSPVVWLVLAAFALSQAAAVARGVADAGGFAFGWFQGYREPMNSLRLAKPLLAALLLLPLWTALHDDDAVLASRRLSHGFVAGLAAVALAALWERHAYTELLNFSSDYRTTALFWEMHVGGAALDGFLAIGMPFAVRELLRAQHSRPRAAALAAVVLLGVYASLTTFSRIVYLAVPVGLAVMLWVHWRQGHGDRTASRWSWLPSALIGLAFVAGFAWGASLMFPRSGYRGMLALLGTTMVLLVLPAAARACRPAQRWAGLAGGFGLAALAGLVFAVVPKGAYHAYAAMALLALLAFLGLRRRPAWAAPGLLAAFVALVACTALVARHWGGAAALLAAWPALALLLVLGLATAFVAVWPQWPQRLRWQGLTAGAMVLAGAVVATFGGGVYMSGRFTTVSSDLEGRFAHWRQGLAMLQSPDQLWLGRGLGRYVDHYAFHAGNQQPGNYRLRRDDGGPYLTLAAGQHELGWGELLRLSQRIALPQGPTTMALEVRSAKPAVLHFEVCLKHLLYDGGCLVKQLRAPGKPGEWQTLRGVLDGHQLKAGAWYAPKWVVFSLASESPSHLIDVRHLSLTDTSGQQLLANGTLDADLARWFMSSDRHHLPWHIKNIVANVIFEQGLAGALLLAALVAGALLRITMGPARTHALAPAVAGALAGFLVVGLFDSLLDVPRVAFLFYWLVLLALASRKLPPRAPRP